MERQITVKNKTFKIFEFVGDSSKMEVTDLDGDFVAYAIFSGGKWIICDCDFNVLTRANALYFALRLFVVMS